MSSRTVRVRSHEDLLEGVARELDIPESKYEAAVRSYESLGAWLDREGSALISYDPKISPQGSMLLGTVVRPVDKDDDYDVDLVCLLQAKKDSFSQKTLKKLVGNEVKLYVDAQNMAKNAKEGRRCWKLQYSDGSQFHIDILPALPDSGRYRQLLENSGYTDLSVNDALTGGAIAITDNTMRSYAVISDEWPSSNPFGYSVWFKERMKVRLRMLKEAYAKDQLITASVDEIPDYKVKTPLQRAIQLLKRHRDHMFGSNNELKPISIIITTLAALSYNNEETIAETLRAVLRGMQSHIEYKDGVAWILNPVNPLENFADKWSETPGKADCFAEWLSEAQKDFGTYLQANAVEDVPNSLREALGVDVVDSLLLSSKPVEEKKPYGAAARAAAVVERIHQDGSGSKPWTR